MFIHPKPIQFARPMLVLVFDDYKVAEHNPGHRPADRRPIVNLVVEQNASTDVGIQEIIALAEFPDTVNAAEIFCILKRPVPRPRSKRPVSWLHTAAGPGARMLIGL